MRNEPDDIVLHADRLGYANPWPTLAVILVPCAIVASFVHPMFLGIGLLHALAVGLGYSMTIRWVRVSREDLSYQRGFGEAKTIGFTEVSEFVVPHYRSQVRARLRDGAELVVAQARMRSDTELPIPPSSLGMTAGPRLQLLSLVAELERRRAACEDRPFRS